MLLLHIRRWLENYRRRRILRKELGGDPNHIKRLEHDIGAVPGQLAEEANKPFWK